MRLALSLILFISSGGGPSLVSSQPFANCDLSSYYSTLQTSPLQTSRDDMHNLIKTTHLHELPYTSSSQRDVWDGLLATDTDSTGQLIHLIYGDKDVAATPYDSGSCDSWNREHIWSRSRGVGDSGADNTDLHHMRPADCNVNSVRSNKYFAQCGTVDALSSCTSPAHTEAAVDTQKDTKSFLPPASKRGDVARAILYMDLRYDGDDPNTENLVVSDCPEDVPNGAGMGYLSQLLQWHLDDPPDEGERSRNGEVCANWQGNRNPFVDYPELAATYFGTPSPLPQNGAGYSCSGPTTPPPTNPPTNNPPTASLIITGVIDGPRSGGLPKAIELYATADIPDLSSYGVGFANNGGGSDGIEFTFPSQSATAGSFFTISYEEIEFRAYFGVQPDFVDGSVFINGDDSIELFYDGQVIDVYGDVNVAGGEWNYMDGWSYRHDASTPSAVFNMADWTLSGINAVDSCTSNGACASVFPSHSYKHFSTGLIITGVIDGPRSGGLPKAVELYATADIPDLSSYGVGFANNGGGSDGIEFTFPSQSATAGSFFTISYEEIEFRAYFGVQPDFVDGSVFINGDDSIELFYDGQVIDVYGDVNVAGGEWNYMDGWSYRHDASTPSAVFNMADWTLSGINAVDSCTSNGACASVFPSHSYKHFSTGLIITGVIDGPRSGGLPKAVELYATADIPDLSSYGVGFANNGGGSDGIEFTFPSQSATAGSFFTISYEETEFQAYFGVQPDFVDGSVYINGDDSIELFYDGQVIDVYGDVNVAGGEWNYMDGWSYRHDASTPSAVFNMADWTLSGVNAADSCAANGACASVFPFHSYHHSKHKAM